MEGLAERVGFEPTAPFGVTGFQDQLLKPLGHLSSFEACLPVLCSMVNRGRWDRLLAGVAGLEPTNDGVKVRCLTDLAIPQWFPRRKVKMASPQGFEPRTHGLEGRCSIQLSYEPKFGADGGNRTRAISLEG